MRTRLFVIAVISLLFSLGGYNLWLLSDLIRMQKQILFRQEEQRAFLMRWSQVVPATPGTFQIQACFDGDDPDDVRCTMPVFVIQQ